MKNLIVSAALAIGTLAVGAEASMAGAETCHSAQVYLMGRQPSNFKSLTSSQSQLIISDLAGVSQNYRASFKEIQTVSDILGDEAFEAQVNGIVVIENGDHVLLEKETPLFSIANSPSGEYFRSFAKQFADDVRHVKGETVKIVDKYDTELKGNERGAHAVQEDVNRLIALEGVSRPFVAHLESLKTVSGSALLDATQKLVHSLEQLAMTRRDGEIIVLVVPSDVCTSVQFKRLSYASDQEVETPEPEEVFSLAQSPAVAAKPTKISGFATKKECESYTNSCSGRGSCVKAGTDYVCACKASKVDGKTTKYGGFACQKIDVSAETQMFLWTGVGIVLAIAAGVGLMYSLDSEPLPGVLEVTRKANL